MTAVLDVEPHFASEAQETFTVGSRVFAVEPTVIVGKGAEGVYVGRVGEYGGAVVDWDTPSGEPYRETADFGRIRNLYR